jgi:uncharacterized protein YjiS (DUF1127 family)
MQHHWPRFSASRNIWLLANDEFASTIVTVSLVNDAAHWRVRAREARALAEQMDDPCSRRTMLVIAQDYEKLAARAEERDAALRKRQQ